MLVAEVQYQDSFESKVDELKALQKQLKQKQIDAVVAGIDIRDLSLESNELSDKLKSLSESFKSTLKDFQKLFLDPHGLLPSYEDIVEFEPNLRLLINASILGEDRTLNSGIFEGIKVLCDGNISYADVLIGLMQNKTENISSRAAICLCEIGNQDNLVCYLKREFIQGDHFRQRCIAKVFGEIESCHKSLTSFMINAMKDADLELRMDLLKSICKNQNQSKPKIKLLIDELKSADSETKGIVMQGLANIGKKAGAASPYLLKELINADDTLRISTLSTLCSIGERYSDVICEKVTEDLTHENSRVRVEAVVVLKTLKGQPKAVVPALIKALSDPLKTVRVGACTALSLYESAAKTALPELAKAIESDSIGLGAILITLGAIGQDAAEITPVLLKKVDSNFLSEGTKPISECISKFRWDALPYLFDAINHKNYEVRHTIVGALKDIMPTKDCIAALTLYLEDPHHYITRAAAEVLGDIARNAECAIPDLIKALDTADTHMTKVTGRALCKFAEIYPDRRKEILQGLLALKAKRLSALSQEAISETLEKLEAK